MGSPNSGLFKYPTPPKPEPAPPPPAIEDPSIDAARRRRKGRSYRSYSMLTGPMGPTGSSTLGFSSLLGSASRLSSSTVSP